MTNVKLVTDGKALLELVQRVKNQREELARFDACRLAVSDRLHRDQRMLTQYLGLDEWQADVLWELIDDLETIAERKGVEVQKDRWVKS